MPDCPTRDPRATLRPVPVACQFQSPAIQVTVWQLERRLDGPNGTGSDTADRPDRAWDCQSHNAPARLFERQVRLGFPTRAFSQWGCCIISARCPIIQEYLYSMGAPVLGTDGPARFRVAPSESTVTPANGNHYSATVALAYSESDLATQAACSPEATISIRANPGLPRLAALCRQGWGGCDQPRALPGQDSGR